MTDYDFRNLSPIDFEEVVRDILSAEFGVPFETYAVGPDGGIDIRHTGQDRTIIVQCKHQPDAKKAQLVASASAELAKWVDGVPQEYYFVTSAGLSPGAVTAVAEALGPLAPHAGHVWARGRLNGYLSNHSEVERRHFKLWLNSTEVLDQVLRAGEWERSESLIHGIRDRVRLYVHTPQYDEALEALRAERVVLISGAPGVGKSTLAEMLLLTHWNAGWKVVNIVDNLGDIWRNLRDPDQKTIFYYDDFLGQTSSLELNKNEGTDLARIIRSLQGSSSGNALFIMTTREQILNSAIAGPDDRIRRAVKGRKRLQVEMGTVSRHSRARMLFNHLYFSYEGCLLLNALSLDTRYRFVIDHRSFNPRVLSDIVLIKKPNTAEALYDELQDALDHPDDIWKSSFDQLSILGVKILLHLTIEPGRSISVDAMESVALLDDPRDFKNALRVLEDSWIQIGQTAEGVHLRLYDPSRRDFLLDQLQSGPVFRQALSVATTLQQIEYLVSISISHPMSTLVVRMAEDIDEIATRRLSAGLNMATVKEKRRASGEKRISEAFHERMAVLTSAVALMALLPAAELVSEALIPAFAFLDDDFTFLRRPTASALFRLAATLDNVHAEWASEHAEKCVLMGIKNIEQADEISEYASLPFALRERLPSYQINNALALAFDAELDGIRQQSDRDMMDTWLSEVEDLAQELGITIYTDSLRNKIDDMPEQTTADHSYVQRVSESINDDDSDAGLAQLFARLASPETLQ